MTTSEAARRLRAMAERKRSAKSSYTSTEVGALIEELRSEFRTVVDIARDVKAEVDGLKIWRAGVDEKLVTLDFVLTELKLLRAELKTFDERLRAVEVKVGR